MRDGFKDVPKCRFAKFAKAPFTFRHVRWHMVQATHRIWKRWGFKPPNVVYPNDSVAFKVAQCTSPSPVFFKVPDFGLVLVVLVVLVVLRVLVQVWCYWRQLEDVRGVLELLQRSIKAQGGSKTVSCLSRTGCYEFPCDRHLAVSACCAWAGQPPRKFQYIEE